MYTYKPLRVVPTMTLLIRILQWSIGLNYLSILMLTHLDLIVHLMVLNNLLLCEQNIQPECCQFKSSRTNCYFCIVFPYWSNNCNGKKKLFHLDLSKVTEKCRYVYILPTSSSAGVALRSALQLPVRQLKGEHLTERKYSLHRFVIPLVPLIWLGWGREGVTRGISLEYLFNILIGNDKHSGAFSPAGEIKDLEFHETQQYGSEPNWSPLASAN